MASSEANRQEKRDRIVDSAVEVFAEKGFRAARISDVARVAGVADGTIYLYFRNKEDLLLVIFEEKMDLLLRDLRERLAAVDGVLAKLKAFARHHFDQLRDHPQLAQVFQVELRQSHRFLREYRPEKLWQYLAVVGGIIEQGQRDQLVRPDVDPFLAQWAFFGALDELSIQWVLARKRDRFPLDMAADQVAELFYRGVAVSF